MRILGVDPGSLRTGWCLLGGSVARPRLLDRGAIRMPAGDGFPERLHGLGVAFDEVVRRLAPTAAAVESPFHGVNARAALQLAHARGVILACLAGEGVPVVEYAPATVKAAVTGNGRAPKEQVAEMVRRLLGRADLREGADVADAAAVALCHLASAALGNLANRGVARRRRRESG